MQEFEGWLKEVKMQLTAKAMTNNQSMELLESQWLALLTTLKSEEKTLAVRLCRETFSSKGIRDRREQLLQRLE